MSKLLEFQEHLVKLKKIVAVVGEGLSALSGLEISWGSQGLWKNFNMIDLATPDAFHIDPGLVWQYYSWRRANALKAKPNRGHKALRQLLKLDGVDFLTITQTIDGLSSRSGHNRQKLLELHGSLFDLKCTSFMCNYVERDNFEHPLTAALQETEEYVKPSEVSPNASPTFTPVKEIDPKDLPQCPICRDGLLLRPGVVWFGESLPLRSIGCADSFLETGNVPDLVLVIGTSGTAYPANSYVDRVKLKGGKVAVFNTDIDEEVSQGNVPGTWGFKGDAAQWLPIALRPLIGELERIE